MNSKSGIVNSEPKSPRRKLTTISLAALFTPIYDFTIHYLLDHVGLALPNDNYLAAELLRNRTQT